MSVAGALFLSFLLAGQIEGREVSETTFKSVDGLEIKAVLSMPKGSGPFPLVVTIHGGNSEKPYGYLRTMAGPNRLSPTVNELNKQPWAVLAVSYRNGFMNLGDDDVIAGIRFGAGLPKIDKSKVGIMGGSHGGYKALQAAIRMGREIRCAAAGSPWMVDPVTFMTADPSRPPFVDMKPEVRQRLNGQGRTLFGQMVRRQGSEEAALEFLKSKSALEQCDRIEVPLLLMSSRSDESVPHEFVEPLYTKMKGMNKDVTLFTVQESPHGFYWSRPEGSRASSLPKTKVQEQEESKTIEEVIAFFKRHFSTLD